LKSLRILLATGALLLLGAVGAYAGCWCGNGYSDPNTNFVEAQVWPGDSEATTWMNFRYTTDGSDPTTSGTVQVEPGTFYQFAENNDWFQAWLTAGNGDLVQWYAEAMGADGEVCPSEVYEFTSGVTPPAVPNLVGDCESELGGTGDWNNGDPLTDMPDLEMDGIYSVSLTATGDFASGGGSGYQVVGTSGSWSPQYPGDSNIPIQFTTGEEITFYIDTNAQPGWSPESNAVWDSKLATEPHTWAAVGGWQGWDPTNAGTQLADLGGGILGVVAWVTAGAGHEFKCAADGGWDLQCGTNGYGQNCNTWFFDLTEDQWVGFYLDTNTGRIRVDLEASPVATQDESWGSIKSLFR